MKRLLLIAFICLFSCTDELPADIISASKFESVLYDVHLTDAILVQSNLSDRKLKSPKDSYYNHIYIKHNISRKEFEKSVHHYSQNTITYKSMYDRILIKITNEKNDLLRLDSIQKRNKKRITDSIQQIKKTIDSLRQDSLAKIIFELDSLSTDSTLIDSITIKSIEIDSSIVKTDSTQFSK